MPRAQAVLVFGFGLHALLHQTVLVVEFEAGGAALSHHFVFLVEVEQASLGVLICLTAQLSGRLPFIHKQRGHRVVHLTRNGLVLPIPALVASRKCPRSHLSWRSSEVRPHLPQGQLIKVVRGACIVDWSLSFNGLVPATARCLEH